MYACVFKVTIIINTWYTDLVVAVGFVPVSREALVRGALLCGSHSILGPWFVFRRVVIRVLEAN